MTPTTTTNAPSTAPEKALCTNLGTVKVGDMDIVGSGRSR